jgi:hypothetical protein
VYKKSLGNPTGATWKPTVVATISKGQALFMPPG